MKKTSLGHGTIYLTLSTITFVASGYFINIWLGRYLGPASYGIYGVIISLMTVINLTQTAGLPLAVAKFISEDEPHSDSILKTGLILQIISTLLATLLFILLAVPLAQALHDLSLIPYIRISAAVFPLYGIYSVYLNYYNGRHYFKTQALMSIIYAIAKLLAVIVFVYLFHVYGAILGFIVAPLIALIVWFRMPKNIDYHFSYKKLILFSFPLVGFAIFSNLLQSVDLFFVKSILHIDKNTGFYTANQNIAELPFYGVTALATVLFPSISKSVSQGLHEQTRNLITKSVRFSLLITVPSVLLISATSQKILSLLYSSAYYPGASSLAILVLGSGFFTLFIILSTIISSSGSPGQPAILAGAGVLLSSALCLILIPHFGLNGAALATTIAACISMIIAAIIVYRKFKILIFIKSLMKILLASLLIYFLARIISVPVLFLPFLYLILFIMYAGMLILMKEIKKEDIDLVKSLLPLWIIRKRKI